MSRAVKKAAVAAPLVSVRNYQQHTLDAVVRYYEKMARKAGRVPGVPDESPRKLPFSRPVCCLPTGSGKTIIFLLLAQYVFERWGWRTLVIVPDKRLVGQIVKSARKYFPGLRCGTMREAWRRMGEFEVVVSTAQGLGPKRRSHIPSDYFQLNVWDECHQVPARTFHAVFRYFAGAEISVGFSATIKRGDGTVVANTNDDYFAHLVSYYTLSQLSEAGYVVPIHGYFVDTKTSLKDVGRSMGDYDKRELATAVNNPERNELAVEAWKRHADLGGGRWRPTVAFCVNISHARAVADCFAREGVEARVVHNKMADDEYERVMEDYEAGRVSVIVNVRLCIQGWDAPWTSLVLILRPATPAAMCVLAPQMVGRGVRLCPERGKKDLIVIELVDRDVMSFAEAGSARAGRRAGGVSVVRVGGRERVYRNMIQAAMGSDCAFADEGMPLHLQARAHEQHVAWLERKAKMEEAKAQSGEEGEKDFYYDVVERITQASRYTWIPLGTSSLFMLLGEGDYVELYEKDEFHYALSIVHGGRLVEKKECMDKREAMSFAHAWLRGKFIEVEQPCEVEETGSSRWREGPPLPLHIGQAQSLTGLSYEYLEGLTMGQVCDLITTVTALGTDPSELESALPADSPLWRDAPVQYGLAFV